MERFASGRLLAAVLSASVLGPAAAQEPPAAPANYVAHEWGTFTSMVGKAGVVLEGLQREEEALPGFVHDLLKVEEYAELKDCKLPASRVTQKMETPVIYFHTDEPLRVTVDVTYPEGLMTQFFPLPSAVMPRIADARRLRVDMSTVKWSWLQWNVDLVPRSRTAPAEIPVVAADHPWAWARQVDCAWVRTVVDGTPARPEAEHYLFYRGLGRRQPDVGVKALGDGAFEVRNGLKGKIPFVAVLEMSEHGGRFTTAASVDAGASRRFDLGRTDLDGDREMVSRRLGAAVQQALEATGLYQDEARAMVATWSRSWFQSDGSRVVYVLPREQVDEMLPLSLTPAPKELVRTLVGRIECITPEAQRHVEQAIRDHDSPDATTRERAVAELRHLDRFLEPHLRNVVQSGADASVRTAAARLLAETTR